MAFFFSFFYASVCLLYIRSECGTYLWFPAADVSVEVATWKQLLINYAEDTTDTEEEQKS